jgi:hypothetical protein
LFNLPDNGDGDARRNNGRPPLKTFLHNHEAKLRSRVLEDLVLGKRLRLAR